MNALSDGLMDKPYVAYIEQDDIIDWNTKDKVNYRNIPLTFNIISAGTIAWFAPSTQASKTIQYSLNDGEWTSITATDSETYINVEAGDVIKFRGDNAAYGGDYGYSSFYSSTAKFDVEGNIMSLIDSTGYTTAETLTGDRNFSSMFSNTHINSAENLVLPATALTEMCYSQMFISSKIIKAPKVIGTSNMTLESNSCNYMFGYCTGLTSSPELPAATLASRCYQSMFEGCENLNNVKCLATNISASNCTVNWLYGVAQSGVFTKKSGVNWPDGYDGIPTGWTVIEE